MRRALATARQRVSQAPAFRALGYADFRRLWFGAFLSFTGSQIQAVAQGYLVYEMTGDPAKLALVMFCSMVPVSFLGPFLGVFADVMNKRTVLVVAMSASAIGPLFLAVATWQGFLQYWHIIAAALLLGFVQTVELPARQSIVRTVVHERDLASAIPMQAMTFNLARVVGPAIGGLLAASFGAAACFLVNGLSYSGLMIAALRIRADLSPQARQPQPVKDLLLEGMLYTFRERTLRTLFLLEGTTSVFGVFYLALMPAIAKTKLGLDEAGLGTALSCVGLGAVCGILLLASLADRPVKTLLIRVSMMTLALALAVLGLSTSPSVAFPALAVIGACTIIQFNSTNTLFQLIAPERLRGRVLSMHMWAISGLAPLGIIGFGWIAREFDLQSALLTGAAVVFLGAVLGWMARRTLAEPAIPPREEAVSV